MGLKRRLNLKNIAVEDVPENPFLGIDPEVCTISEWMVAVSVYNKYILAELEHGNLRWERLEDDAFDWINARAPNRRKWDVSLSPSYIAYAREGESDEHGKATGFGIEIGENEKLWIAGQWKEGELHGRVIKTYLSYIKFCGEYDEGCKGEIYSEFDKRGKLCGKKGWGPHTQADIVKEIADTIGIERCRV